MAIRLIISITAAPGKGAELLDVYRGRCADVQTEPGCLQFEIFQSGLDADKLVILEHWADQESLDVHSKVNETRAPIPDGLRAGGAGREDYEYNKTR